MTQGPENGDAPSGEDDEGLGVMLSLAPFTVVEGLGHARARLTVCFD